MSPCAHSTSSFPPSTAMLRRDVFWNVAYLPPDHAIHRPSAQLRFSSKTDGCVFFAYTFGSGFCAFRNSVTGRGTGTGQLVAEEGRDGQHLGLEIPERIKIVKHWVFLYDSHRVMMIDFVFATLVDLAEAPLVDPEPSKDGRPQTKRFPDGQCYTVLRERKIYLAEHKRAGEESVPEVPRDV